MANKTRIVLVDDEEILLTVITKKLSEQFEAISFINPIMALEYIRENHNQVDILLTDYKMPVLDGIELILTVEKINPAIKKVLLTAYSDMLTKNTKIPRCDLLLEKSILQSLDELVNMISTLIE
ncbi:MAG: hypothetical protein DKM50_01460 [Candidatus Margulisiibacteriota bacterium]|nr:MAG: hypothetical protein A2X43_08350 [Candidatus Margulisbacteria bacterium GWD2_39_127]OGI01293.1 MAG: hypothetical protein A2X42_06035 [Candidatus Margulisbacteria bacterium GWF2_38_17]OGI09237.1 MAG: hypothetical protein A2X41_01520 [Candidatus Margulisbacteria bacterium GWE2_39_32]PZM83770.1 MAG: hypothetical protein DKM50_01460 [Candidatus Margulisiibacteriota bacterium]HAR63038.1 hypothetical protein [Candidatus Margulisiibacteriota bacterium]